MLFVKSVVNPGALMIHRKKMALANRRQMGAKIALLGDEYVHSFWTGQTALRKQPEALGEY